MLPRATTHAKPGLLLLSRNLIGPRVIWQHLISDLIGWWAGTLPCPHTHHSTQTIRTCPSFSRKGKPNRSINMVDNLSILTVNCQRFLFRLCLIVYWLWNPTMLLCWGIKELRIYSTPGLIRSVLYSLTVFGPRKTPELDNLTNKMCPCQMSWADGSCWSLWWRDWHFRPIRGEHCLRLTNPRSDICPPSRWYQDQYLVSGLILISPHLHMLEPSWLAPTGSKAQIFWFQASH